MERRHPAVDISLTTKGGKGEMTKTPVSLQDLRKRIYDKAKADKTRKGFGWNRWSSQWIDRSLGLFSDYRIRHFIWTKALPAR